MRTYDYTFLKDKIPATTLHLASIIYDIRAKEKDRINKNPRLFDTLLKKAIRDSIKGSNAIENIYTTDSRLDAIIKGESNPRTHNEAEMIGYRNVLNNIHTYNVSIKFDKKTIISMHEEMMKMTGDSSGGCLKKESNIIVEEVNGKQIPVFIPIAPDKVEEELDALIESFQKAMKDPLINPLLSIPCFILDFLCIHPFDDGNGRISRLLTLLLLYKAGFDIGRFISIENMINEYKNGYYEALQASSRGWHTNSNNYEPFMIFMIKILYECYVKMDKNVFDKIDQKLSKRERVETLLLNAFVPMSKKDIVDQLPDVSEKLIELCVSDMLKAGKIKKIGTYRNARYYRV